MEINNLSAPTQSLNENNQVKPARAEVTSAQQQTGKSTTAETISLTDAATSLSKLSENVAKEPVIDAQKVEDIKLALENGSYKIDPEQIAKKFTQLEAELAG